MVFLGTDDYAQAVFEVAYSIVTSDIRAAWKSGSEFANI